jgi:tetratricopeptide (TPR) repeat protein
MATIGEALSEGIRLHQSGQLQQAEHRYREVLARDPRHSDAWHLLGLVAHARGDQAAAQECITRAIRLDGSQPVYHNHLAEVFRAQGQWAAAEAACRQALRLNPGFALAHNTLGGVLAAQGRYADAVDCYRQALAIDPHLANAHFNLGAALHAQHQHEAAIANYRQAIACDPRFVPAYNNLGAALAEAGRADEAIAAYRQVLAIEPRLPLVENNLGGLLQAGGQRDEAVHCYRRAIEIDPNYAGAHCNLGGALMELGRNVEAVESLHRALQLNPQLPQAHFNLGVILQTQGQREAAMRSYQQVLELRRDHVQALNNLGTLYRLQGEFSQACQCYQRVLEVQPDSPEALNNLGNVFKTQGRVDEAWVCYDQTLRIKPSYAQARYNRSLLDLAAGRLAEGWPDYEFRSACPEFAKRVFDQPRWSGEPLAGRTLLVFAEQGLGDVLQFVRYLPLLAAFGGQVVFECPPALMRLLTRSGFEKWARLVPKRTELPAFDFQVPLLSLPGIFETTLANIPGQQPYLASDEQLVAHWRDKLAGGVAVKIGIAWQGSTTYVGDRYRSIPLQHFAPLAQRGVELISLQKGAGTEQLAKLQPAFPVRVLDDLDEQQGPFMDTAAVIRNLDLVITSDTALAHLAGALGAPTWVALPLEPDWRWMRARPDSPWYPTLRLFRQHAFDAWPPVFERIAAALAQGLAASSTPPRSFFLGEHGG